MYKLKVFKKSVQKMKKNRQSRLIFMRKAFKNED
jgi:hypothetical protein